MSSQLQGPDRDVPATDGTRGTSRRTVLRAAGVAGAATAAAGLTGRLHAAAPAAGPASAPAATSDNVARWRPDPDSPRFTLAVMPDTQYLFDGRASTRTPVEASLRYLLEHGARREHRLPVPPRRPHRERPRGGARADRRGVPAPRPARRRLQRARRQPRRRAPRPTTSAADPVPGRLRAAAVARAADLRRRLAGRLQHLPPLPRRRPAVAGARAGLAAVRRRARLGEGRPRPAPEDARSSSPPTNWCTPTTATTPALRRTGSTLWDELIADHDQIFLTLNGHYWPAARATVGRTPPATTSICTSPTTRTATTAARR